MNKGRKMKSYEAKGKGLFLVFIAIPILVVTTSLIWQFLSEINHEYRILIVFLFLLIECFIFILLTKGSNRFLSEEIDLVKNLNFRDMNHQQLKLKTEKIYIANERLNEILQELVNHDVESENNIVKYNQETRELESRSNSVKHKIKVQEKIDDALIDLTSQFLIQVDANGFIKKINKSLPAI